MLSWAIEIDDGFPFGRARLVVTDGQTRDERDMTLYLSYRDGWKVAAVRSVADDPWPGIDALEAALGGRIPTP